MASRYVYLTIGLCRQQGKNRVRLVVGHYAGPEGGQPKEGMTIEITDTSISSVFRSDHLDVGSLNWLCPHPLNYKLVWSQTMCVGRSVHSLCFGRGAIIAPCPIFEGCSRG